MESTFYDLATKLITEEASSEERDQLNQMLQDDPDLEAQLDELKAAWEKAGDLELNSFAEEDWDKVASSLEKKVSPKTISIGKHRWMSMAAAVALIAVTSLFIWNSMQWEQVTASNGNLEIQLPDKSIVTLREGSSLSYHYNFEEYRNLKLEGEAYFEVAKDPFHPFVVASGNTQVQVLGTQFNVYTEADRSTEVHVTEGRVKFSSDKAEIILKPGMAARYSVTKNSIESIDFLNGNTANWSKKKLIFENESLDAVMKDLEHYFNIEIQRSGIELDCGFTGKFEDPELESVLKTLERTLNLKFKQVENAKWIIKEGGC